jgi:hypothetical protein
MEKNPSPWTVPVAVDDIPETGLHLEIDAAESVRSDLAALAGLRALPWASAVFDLERQGAGARVTGTLRARVGQTCVVSLEPIERDLEEAIDLAFAPPVAESVRAEAEPAGSRTSEEEPPEPLVGGKLDLGAIATEFLLLGIDPYPRKPGAEFAPLKAGAKAVDDRARPFAALEALKKRPGGG